MYIVSRCLFVMVIVCLLPLSSFAMEAVPDDSMVNRIRWDKSGDIEARCFYGESMTDIGCITRWDLNLQKRIGQTFRCAGPILAGVQLGIHNGIDADYVRLYYAASGPKLTVRVKKGGPDGKVVAEKIFLPNEIGATPLLEVNQPSNPSILWYYEIEPEHRNFPSGQNRVSITYDNYPEGCMWRDGKKVSNRDLPLVVYRRWDCKAKVDGKVLFWWAPSEERIWLEAETTAHLMLTPQARGEVRMASARNEWETFQLIATPAPQTKITKAVLTIKHFEGPKGTIISRKNVRISWLRYSKEYNPKCVRIKTVDPVNIIKGYGTSGILYPDPLIPTNTAVIAEKHITGQFNTAFVVSVYVPANVPAGVYKSKAKLIVNNKVICEKTIALEVFNFVLPHKTHTRTALFCSVAGTLKGQIARINRLADFRIALPAAFKDPTGILRKGKFSEKTYEIAFGKEMQQGLIQLGQLLNRRGLDVCAVMPWADTYRMYRGQEGGREGIIRFWNIYYPILKKYGWVDQAYARMPDEITVKQIHKARPIADLFRKYAPGVKIMVTATGSTNPNDLSKVIGLPDIWTPGISTMRKNTLQFFHQRMQAGEQVWPYIHDSIYQCTDPAAGRMFFWVLQREGFGGCTYWNIGPRGRYKPAWFGIIRRDTVWSGDAGLLYPGNLHSVWGSEGGGGGILKNYWLALRLHRIRDGIEDREYFWLMNHLAENLRKEGKLTDALRKKIDRLNNAPREVTFGTGSFIHDPERINQIRKKLADTIVELQNCSR